MAARERQIGALSPCTERPRLIHSRSRKPPYRPFPDDVETLEALLTAALQRADEAEARAANAIARESAIEAVIAHLKPQIAKLRREQYGPSAERSRRLLEQMELKLEDLEADASENDLAAEDAAASTTNVAPFERKRSMRKPFPEHLPRERVVISAPCSCPTCGGSRLSRLGEDVTETPEVIGRAWKIIQTVREKVLCRDSPLELGIRRGFHLHL